MRRFGLAAVLLVAIAVVEIVVFVAVARLVGLGWALLLLLASTLLGGVLLRREGPRAWRRFQAAVQAGGPPGNAVTAGLVALLAAVLLVIPGFVTDLVGLALLVPPVRSAGTRLLRRFAERRLSPGAAGELFGPHQVRVRRPQTADSPVIEGEVVDGPDPG